MSRSHRSKSNLSASAAIVAGAEIAPALPPEATVPSVPDTVPLASDQISAPQVPVAPSASDAVTVPASVVLGGVSGQAVVGIEPDAPVVEAELPPAAPTPVPDHVPLDELVAPADTDAHSTRKPPLVHVPGTVPLPADQTTPMVRRERPDDLAGVAGGYVEVGRGEPEVTQHAQFRVRDVPRGAPAFTDADTVISAIQGGKVSPELLASWRDAIGKQDARSVSTGDDGVSVEPKREFGVLFEVDHDGIRYYPGGDGIVVTFDEWQQLWRAAAIAADWTQGREAEPLA